MQKDAANGHGLIGTQHEHRDIDAGRTANGHSKSTGTQYEDKTRIIRLVPLGQVDRLRGPDGPQSLKLSNVSCARERA